MKMRDSFIFYRSFQNAIDEASEKEQLTIYKAISGYALDRKEPAELEGLGKVAWALIKPLLDANWNRYQNGCKGGAPKGNNNNRFSKKYNRDTTEVQPKYNQSTTEIQPNDNDIIYNSINTINNNISNKDNIEDIYSKKLKPVDLSFVATEFLPIFQTWLDYKKERKESYKSTISTKTCYKHLLELCGSNVATAEEIVNRSIANNWKGLFELPTKSNHNETTLERINRNQAELQQSVLQQLANGN